MEISSEIKKARARIKERKRFTLSKIAKRTGYSLPYISLMLRGKRKPTNKLIQTLKILN